MSDLTIKVHETLNVWRDLLHAEADSGYRVMQDADDTNHLEFVVIDEATEDGRPALYIRQEFLTGEIVIAKMSLRTFLQGAKMVMDSYVDEVRQAFRIE